MGKLVAKGSKYSEQKRMEVAVLYAISGNAKQVARDTGIPRTTIVGWKKTDWWEDAVRTIRSEKADEHRAMYSELVSKAQQVTLEKLPEASAAQAHLIACQAIDKVRLLDGMPTEIADRSSDMVALANKYRRLSDQWNEKQVNVVATQDETEEDDRD